MDGKISLNLGRKWGLTLGSSGPIPTSRILVLCEAAFGEEKTFSKTLDKPEVQHKAGRYPETESQITQEVQGSEIEKNQKSTKKNQSKILSFSFF